MTNKLNSSLKIVTVALASVMLVVSATYARTTYSKKTSITNGAKAVCSLETYPARNVSFDNNAIITCDITDTKADGNTPYVRWKIDGYREIRFYGSGPNGTRVTRVDSAGIGDGIGSVQFRACRDEGTLSRDDCDKYDNSNTWKVN